MADQAKTVQVRALQIHTHNGQEYAVGATYALPEDLVASVQAQGKAVPVDVTAAAAPKTRTKDVDVAPRTTESVTRRAGARGVKAGKKGKQ